MTSVGVVDRSSLDVKSLGRKMIERWSEQNMRARGGGDEVEGIERDSGRQERAKCIQETGMERARARARERERERHTHAHIQREREGGGRELEMDEATRSGVSGQRKMYLAQGVDKHSLPLGSILLFLKVVARRLAHRGRRRRKHLTECSRVTRALV